MLYSVTGIVLLLLTVTANAEKKYCDAGQFYNGVRCELCPKGHISPSLEMKEERRCYPCPMGSYQDIEGGRECITCPDKTFTYNIASTSLSDCKPIAFLENAVKIELRMTASVSGKLCAMKPTLWESNRITAASILECSEYVLDGRTFTKFVVSMETKPAVAISIANVLSYGYRYSYANAWIPKLKSMFEDWVREESPLGIKFNPDMLNWDIRVGMFTLQLFQKCLGSYTAMAGKNGLFEDSCQKSGTVDEDETVVLAFSLSGADTSCKHNAVQTVLSLAFAMDKQKASSVFGISNAESYFVKCVNTDAGSEAIVAVKGKDVTGIQFDENMFNAILSQYADLTVAFKATKGAGCNLANGEGYAYEDGDLKCVACLPGYYSSKDTPSCTPCGYDTYSSENGCKGCAPDRYTFSRISSKDSQCLAGPKIAQDQGSFTRSIREFDERPELVVELGFEINWCEVHAIRVELLKLCSARNQKTEFDDMICNFVKTFNQTYDDVCLSGGVELDPTLKDMLCEVMKPLANLEEDITLNECKRLSKDETTSDINYAFPESNIRAMDLYVLGELVLLPLLNLPGTTFKNFNAAIETILTWLGIMDLNAFTNTKTLNSLLEILMALTRNTKCDLFKIDVNVNETNLQCQNGNVKYACDSWACTDELRGSPIRNYWNVICEADQCNACNPTAYHRVNDTKGEKIDLKSLECDFPIIPNAVVERRGRFYRHYSCKPGYIKSGVYSLYCSNLNTTNPPQCTVGKQCNFNETIDNGSLISTTSVMARYRCDDFYYQVTDVVECYNGEILPPPRCLPLNEYCEFPEKIRNGSLVEVKDRKARYDCDDGFYSGGKVWFECRSYNYKDDICQRPDCVFPKTILGGQKFSESKSWAYYECDEGLLINTERNNPGIARCVDGKAKVPTCFKPPRGCAFPVRIPGGRAQTLSAEGASYSCDEGHVLMPTIRGNEAVCREDGSMALPSCVPEEHAYNIDFKLVNDYVLVKVALPVGETGWMAVCDDNFNDYAAGAACRHLKQGRHGIKLNTKKDPPPNDIGYTQVNCKYDDTLFYDRESCHYKAYDYKTDPFCFNEEKVAISCYDQVIAATTTLKIKKKGDTSQLTCSFEVKKQGVRMSVSNISKVVEFFSVNKKNKETKLNGQLAEKKGAFVLTVTGGVKCAYCKVKAQLSDDYALTSNSKFSGKKCPKQTL